MRKSLVKFSPVFVILALTLFLRLFWLDKFPTGIINDELYFVLNAKLLALGSLSWFFPFNLAGLIGQINTVTAFALIASIIGPLNLSLWAARLPFVILNTCSVLFLYLIVRKLTDQKLAFVVGLVAAINPWFIYVGRTSFDANIALTFYLLAFYLLLNLKGWKILWTTLPFALGFWGYIGTKVLFVPLVLILVGYAWYFVSKKAFLKQYLLVLLFSALVFISYTVSLHFTSSGSRLSELSSLSAPQISQQVDSERRMEVAMPFSGIFSNKVVVYGQNFLNKYLDNFSTDLLFVRGDNAMRVTLWQHGYFYYLDALFLLIGFVVLWKKHKQVAGLLTALILIAPLPEALRIDSLPAYALHSVLLYPFLTVFVGIGIYYTVTAFADRRLSRAITGFIIVAYLFSLGNLLNIYFFRYPIYNSESFDFSARVLSKYINSEEQKGREVYIIGNENDTLFRQFIFYNNLLTPSTANKIAKITTSDPGQGIDFGYAHFLQSTDNLALSKNYTVIINKDKGDVKFRSKYPHLSIAQLSDGGEVFAIYNGKTCAGVNLEGYVHNLTLNDFNVEKLPEEVFCQKFITQLP